MTQIDVSKVITHAVIAPIEGTALTSKVIIHAAVSPISGAVARKVVVHVVVRPASISGNLISGFTRQVFAVETTISLDTLARIARGTDGMGMDVGSGDDNVFALLTIRKVG